VLTQGLSGRSQIELGSLEPKRDLTFVKDTARAFRLAVEKPGIEGETIHFGSGQAISIGDLARKCLEIVGSEAQILSRTERVRPEKSEVGLLLCNSEKAQRLLGWTPQVSLAQGLQQTAEYVQTRLSDYPVESYSV
jgi:nucleoside-diphosphate-sugar epimerase